MADPQFFTVEALYKSVVADSVSDLDANPQLGPVTATVTFTPMLKQGDVILAVNNTGGPVGYVPAPIVARIDTDGRLKLRVDPDLPIEPVATFGALPAVGLTTKTYKVTATNLFYVWDTVEAEYVETYGFQPVRLLDDTELLDLDGDLYYDVRFSNVVFNGGRGDLSGFGFKAPGDGSTVNLIEVGKVPGIPAPGQTRGPRGWRSKILPINEGPFAGMYQWYDEIGEPWGDPQELYEVISEVMAEAAATVAAEAVTPAIVTSDIEDRGESVIPGVAPGTVRKTWGSAVSADFPAVVGLWKGIAGKPMTDPRDYAEGVGIGNDDTDALVATLDYAGVNGHIIVPPGATLAYEAVDLVFPKGCLLSGPGSGGQLSGGARLLAASADARIILDDSSKIQHLRLDGGGVANIAVQTAADLASQPCLEDVFIKDFAEYGMVFDAAQNGTMRGVVVRNTPYGYAFLNGAANLNLYTCSYQNFGSGGTSPAGVGGINARAILVKNDIADPRFRGALAYEGGGREILFHGGIYEGGHPLYRAEILNAPSFGGHITFDGGAQLSMSDNPNAAAAVHMGPDVPRTLSLIVDKVVWSTGVKTVKAEGGSVVFDKHKLQGSGGGNVMSRTDVSGTGRASFGELTRKLIDSQFQTTLFASESYDWTAYAGGSISWNATDHCADVILTATTQGIRAFFSGRDEYAKAGQPITVRFLISGVNGPVRLCTYTPIIGATPAFVTPIGTFGNGAHEVVYQLVGTETGLALTSDSSLDVTAKLWSIVCDHGVTGANSTVRVPSGSAALNFGVVPAHSFQDLTISVPGAVVGDCVVPGTPVGAVTSGLSFSMWVSAADVVTVRANNFTAADSANPASATFKATIVR